MRTYWLNKLNDNKFILVFAALFFIIQSLIAPIYISPPDIPHDFGAYINNAKVVQGLTESHIGGLKLDYGYLFALLFAAWGKFLGFDYLLMKFPSIIFTTLNVIIIFYLVKEIINEEAAKYGSIFFAFSYLTLSISSVDGKDDSMFLFFLLVSIYLLLKDRPNYSTIAMGISLSFKVVPAVILPPIMFYIYQKSKLKNSFQYLFLAIFTSIIILIPWYLTAGYESFFPVQRINQSPTWGIAPLHLLSMILNNFIVHQPPDTANSFIIGLNPILTAIGYFFISVYIFRFRLQDKRVELIRNIFLFFIIWYLTAKFLTAFYLFWLLPFVIILLLYKDYIKYSIFKLYTYEIIGITSILISIILYSWKYRWVYEYTPFDRILLVISVFLSFFGTYLTLIRSRFKLPWSLIVFASALFNTGQARLLMLFPSVIGVATSKSTYYNYLTDEKILFWASWYVYIFITGILMLISLLFIFKMIHKNFIET